MSDLESRNSSREWFIFAGDKHAGPVNEERVVTLIREGVVGRDAFLWHAEIQDWQAVEEFHEFGLYRDFLVEQSADPGILSREVSRARERVVQARAFTEETSQSPAKPSLLTTIASRLGAAEPEAEKTLVAVSTADTVLEPQRQTLTRNARGRYLWPLLAAVVLASVWAFQPPTWRRLLEGQGLSQMDVEALGSQVRADLEKGASLGVILVRAEGGEPPIFIGTNLPDDSVFKIKIDGVRGAIPDRLALSLENTISVRNGVGWTLPMRDEHGERLPKGMYRIEVTAASGEPRWISDIFIGTDDVTHQSAVRLFEEQLRPRTQQESAEIEQMAGTLEGQWELLNDHFAIKGAGHWSRLRREWVPMQNQIARYFDRIDPRTAKFNFVLGTLYVQLKATNALLESVFQSGPESNPDVEARLKRARLLIDSTRARLELVRRELTQTRPDYSKFD